MKLSPDLLSETAGAVRKSCSVPLPGGHGAWFPDIRERYGLLASDPCVEARCYVCLVLLAEGEGEQRWNPKEWWPHALAWFDIYCPDIASRIEAPRWAYLLAAMLQVANAWLESQPQNRHLKAFAADCHSRAQDRLRHITRYGQAKDGLATVPQRVAGVQLDPPDQRWRNAADELQGPDAERVEMLHFLFVLHSQLGVAQHSADERYATRVPFYSQLQQILEQGTGLTDALQEAASRITRAVATTVLLARSGEKGCANAGLMARLPASFQVAHHLSRSPPRALIELRLADAPLARDRLLSAYDLGMAVADLAMDIFRSGGTDGPAFRPSAYDYLHSLIRYGPKMYAEQVEQGMGSEAAANTMLSGVPMTRSFAERMRGCLLVGPARARLQDDLGQL